MAAPQRHDLADRIEIVSASAGSGKTYRLADTLTRALDKGEARPEAVVATTFTKKAAAELQERARRFLIQSGRLEDAHRLSAARIGTINAVCGQLIREQPFALGQVPDLQVLDETAAQRIFGRAIARVVTARELDTLGGLERRMEAFKWHPAVNRIVTLARVNNVAPDALEDCKSRSLTGMLSLLDPPEPTLGLDQELELALKAFIDGVDQEVDTTKKTQNCLRLADRIYQRVRRGHDVKWSDWRRLSTMDVAVKSTDVAEPLMSVAARHLAHPRLRSDIKQGIGLCFEIARRTLEAYTAYKAEWGVIDFADQELLCLKLLDRPEVVRRLDGEIDLVLVDEFQDTSPIQLEIFLKLAGLAKRSVWVGDQKQSIYAFRGTDPALMDAAVREIAPDGPETLDRSYRSRPSLVGVTSEVFAYGFGVHGVPERFVRLEPAVEDEEELGPSMEWWTLESKNVTEDAQALASVVVEFLADPDVRVRDPHSGASRPIRPEDLAILCRTNQKCRAVAKALDAQCLRPVLPRTGLLDTHEGRLIFAGLRRWLDPYDRLAAATIVRLTDPTDDWLHNLADPQPAPEPVQRLDAARRAQPLAAPLSVLDHVLEALDIRALCLAWGDADERLANVDAVRQHVAAMMGDAASDHSMALPGVVAQLSRLREEELDDQAVVGADDAVTVSTWHGAKGLEWPVTVLFDLDKEWTTNLLGVSVANDEEAIDLNEPLAGRWIRNWINPYHPWMKVGTFFERLEEMPAIDRARQSAAHEDLRLLYVGWTRARDRLILAARDGNHKKGLLGLACFLDDNNRSVFTPPDDGGVVRWCGMEVSAVTRTGSPAETDGPTVRRQPYPEPAGPRRHPPAVALASEQAGKGEIAQVTRLGPRLAVEAGMDMDRLGQAVHGFIAADDPSLPARERLALAEGLLHRWEVSGWLAARDCVAAADRLWAWLEDAWPDADWIGREIPMQLAQEDGTVLAGTADLVAHGREGLLLVDHKTFPGHDDEGLRRSAGFAGQLAAYARMLEAATGEPVRRKAIHLPVLGLVVEVA